MAAARRAQAPVEELAAWRVEGAPTTALASAPEGGVTGALVVLGHGAGGDVTDPLLVAVARGLVARGHAVVRFRFGYREAGRKLPDRAPVCEATFRATVAAAQADPRLAGRPLVIGGKSMGGRMATHLAAQGDAASAVVCLGYPLHPAKKPTQLRDAHLPRIKAPLLLVQGTRDALCELALLERVLPTIPNVTLFVVEDGDHGLAVRRASGRTTAEAWGEIVTQIDAFVRAAIAALQPA